jgi:hypothetical protein
MATTRSMTREALAYPFTLHPNALRKLGVAVPEPEPVQVPEPVQEDEWAPYTPTNTADHDDYSPTSPRSVTKSTGAA